MRFYILVIDLSFKIDEFSFLKTNAHVFERGIFGNKNF